MRLQREAHVRLTYLFLARVYRYGLPAPLTPLPEGSRGTAHGVSRRHDAVATCGDTVEHGALAVAQVLCGVRWGHESVRLQREAVAVV